MICTSCRKAADNGQLGVVAHANAGCKSAQLILAEDEHMSTPYDKELLRLREDDAASFCDCQHKPESLVNMSRVDPETLAKIRGRING